MKKIILILISVGLLFSIWFLFLKPADFKAVFKTNVTVGAINQTIKASNKTLPEFSPIHQNSLNNLVQKRTFGDSIHTYTYNLEPLNDSVTQVSIHIKDSLYSVPNRIEGLFKNTDFKKRSTRTVKEFYETIKAHEENHKITIEGVVTVPSKDYAYTSLEGVQGTKALGMMKNISLLQSAMGQYNVPLDGSPSVEITRWNQENDSIHYKFCFPIKKNEADSLPQWKDIKYGSRKEFKALKAVYNGNYITSDRAWYALINYAETHNIKIEKTPYEEFFNNPSMGGDALKWKAFIYMPIKE